MPPTPRWRSCGTAVVVTHAGTRTTTHWTGRLGASLLASLTPRCRVRVWPASRKDVVLCVLVVVGRWLTPPLPLLPTTPGYHEEHRLAVALHGASSAAASTHQTAYENAKASLRLLVEFGLTEAALRLAAKHRHFETLVSADIMIAANSVKLRWTGGCRLFTSCFCFCLCVAAFPLPQVVVCDQLDTRNEDRVANLDEGVSGDSGRTLDAVDAVAQPITAASVGGEGGSRLRAYVVRGPGPHMCATTWLTSSCPSRLEVQAVPRVGSRLCGVPVCLVPAARQQPQAWPQPLPRSPPCAHVP